jgi:hypothetical protein
MLLNGRIWPNRDIRGIESPLRRGSFLFLALRFSQPQRGCASSVRQDGALLYPGPSAAAGGWRISPQGGRHGCRPVWRQSMDGLSTNPVTRTRTFRAGSPESAEAGWPSLWFLSLGHSRERDSPSVRRTKAFALNAASTASCRRSEAKIKSEPLPGPPQHAGEGARPGRLVTHGDKTPGNSLLDSPDRFANAPTGAGSPGVFDCLAGGWT